MTKSLRAALSAAIRVSAVVSLLPGIGVSPAFAQKAALIKNTDEPGRIPYEVSGEFSPGGACSAPCANISISQFGAAEVILFDLPVVPAGKRLIIKSVSALLPTSSNGLVLVFQTNQSVSLRQIKWGYFGPFSTVDSGQTGISAQATFFTYGPGERPHIWLDLPNPSSPNLIGSVNVSGYLIDASN